MKLLLAAGLVGGGYYVYTRMKAASATPTGTATGAKTNQAYTGIADLGFIQRWVTEQPELADQFGGANADLASSIYGTFGVSSPAPDGQQPSATSGGTKTTQLTQATAYSPYTSSGAWDQRALVESYDMSVASSPVDSYATKTGFVVY